MISNERQWPSRRPPQRKPYYDRPFDRPDPSMMRQPPREDTLETREVLVERKRFLLMLKENPRGRFLRIAEEANGRNNSIIIPASGLHDFQKILADLVTAADEIPPQSGQPSVDDSQPDTGHPGM